MQSDLLHDGRLFLSAELHALIDPLPFEKAYIASLGDSTAQATRARQQAAGKRCVGSSYDGDVDGFTTQLNQLNGPVYINTQSSDRTSSSPARVASPPCFGASPSTTSWSSTCKRAPRRGAVAESWTAGLRRDSPGLEVSLIDCLEVGSCAFHRIAK